MPMNVSRKISAVLLLFWSTYVVAQKSNYSLNNFYQYDSELAYKVDSLYNSLSPKERVAQMLITSAGELGKPKTTVKKLVKNKLVGGVVFLKGSKRAHRKNIQELNTLNKKNSTIPLLYSMDAEPSLLGTRIKGAAKVGKTIDIKTETQSDNVVFAINQELKEIGIHQNYAPVVDVSQNNEAIKHRSYGSDKDSVVFLAKRFIKTTQDGGIIATAKHFPGHGLVKGDTHKQSVYIDGELKEINNYPPLIADGVLSIMVAHITINNNKKYGTNSIPASCSRKIVTDLLKNELQFKGIIISDALNIMKAVTILENPALQASKAGCDLILMPQNEAEALESILTATKKDPLFAKQVEQSVKKILRLKVCSGLL